ncbi:acetylcholine receptor subunit beta-like 1 [Convolutriloba macropyga]|uniref:acetylcholine receptor subunit beta-like 1 n=1 Tax=Convolutriloba macropyga TaxID=536237 RepID=UPI003F52383F
MEFLNIITLFLLMFALCKAYPNLERNLHHDLMVNYSRLGRPVMNFSQPVHLIFGASLYQLKNFDAKQETMSLILWQRVLWTDEYLRWDPAKYGGIGVTRFDVSGIWVPDLMPYNDVGEYNIMHYAEIIPVSVDSNGRVQWLSQSATTTTCTMDVSHFPFDSQTCFVAIGSWQFKQTEVDIDCAASNLDLSSYVEHSQWDLIGNFSKTSFHSE